MKRQSGQTLFARLLHNAVVAAGSLGLTVAFFLVLPLLEAISQTPQSDTLVRSADTGNVPPPPPPPPEEEEEKPEPEPPPPPAIPESAPPLDLSQLELALSPGVGDGALGGDFSIRLNSVTGGAGADMDALFSIADLDQKPRVTYQPSPNMTAEVRRKAPGTVNIVFEVDQNGRVVDPIVQSSTDPVFERAALAAVKQWRFEPGKRGGQPVRFRMRVPISFPKS